MMITARHTLSKSLPFFFGFGFAFLPSYGPFMGLLFFVATRWSLKRSDALWLLAAALFSLPVLRSDPVSLAQFGLSLSAVLVPWLLYKAFGQLPESSAKGRSELLALGLLSGLMLVVALGWLQIDQLAFDRAKTIAQAIVWESNPNLYGHSLLVLGALIAITLPQTRWRLLSLAVSALGILVSGSREAAIAWVVVAVALMFLGTRDKSRSYVLEAGLVLLMLAVASGFGPMLGWGQVGFLLDLVPSSQQSRNVLQGTEIAKGDWWDSSGVTLHDSAPVLLEGATLQRYRLQKTRPEPWQRLQQVVALQAGVPYTVSVWLRSDDPEARPGIQGWGPASGGAAFSLDGRLVAGQWQAQAAGAGVLLDSGQSAAEDGWQRVWITFEYRGDRAPLYWWLGMSPDQRLDRETGMGAVSEFAGFQLERSLAPSSYRPGPATHGLSLGAARLPYWRVAWQGIRSRPLWGFGVDSFPAYYQAQQHSAAAIGDPPSHVHNLLLQVLFERGVLGLLGLLGLLAALSYRAWQQRDLSFLLVLLAVLLANGFDYTLFYGGVLYPLAAVAGWRAVHYQHLQHSHTVHSQVLVRLSLALSDVFAAALAFALATLSQQLLAPALGRPAFAFAALPNTLVFYSLLLWPLMSLREGLYPGYGLSGAQELKKQVLASFHAGILMAALALFIYQNRALPRSIVLLTMLYSMLLSPLGRALTKAWLHRLGMWGQAVVIYGANATGLRLLQALRKRPMQGFRPLAFIGDGEAAPATDLPLPLLEPAVAAAQTSVAMIAWEDNASQAEANALPRLFDGPLADYKQVIVVPSVFAAQALWVDAKDVSGMLGLEIRPRLASPELRALKRCLDLLLTVVGGVLIVPLLLLIYLLIKLDSPGPAFFLQARPGQGGKLFQTVKFRTMHVDAEARFAELPASLREEFARYGKIQHDPRISRMGALLRKTSLDELPQLWNVLRGEMSLVGPRPYLQSQQAQMVGYETIIGKVPPGITGLWQVSGRSGVTFEERLEMDAYYVRNWSVWLDMYILLRTIPAVLTREGAH